MELFLASFTDLLVLGQDKEAADTRSYFHRGQSGGGKKSQLQNMIDTECPNFNCSMLDIKSLDCILEKPTLEKSKHPDVTGLEEDEITLLKSDFWDKKEGSHQKMLECTCCSEISVEEIMTEKGDQDGRSLPFRGNKKGLLQDMVDTVCPDFDCSELDIESLDCTFDKATFQKLKHPDVTELDENKITQLKSDFWAKK